MAKQAAYTKEQEAAARAWVNELARLIRFADGAIKWLDFEPETWEGVEHFIEKIQATAAAGPGEWDKTNPPGL